MHNPILIDEIIGRRETKGKFQYLIKWKSNINKKPSWEPLSLLQKIKNKISDYDNYYEEKEKENMSIIDLKEEDTIIEELSSEKNGKKNNNIIKNKEKLKSKFYKVDKTFKKVIAIKEINGNLYALIEMCNNGGIEKKIVETKMLKLNNPWILIDFYESRAKFY